MQRNAFSFFSKNDAHFPTRRMEEAFSSSVKQLIICFGRYFSVLTSSDVYRPSTWVCAILECHVIHYEPSAPLKEQGQVAAATDQSAGRFQS